MAAERPEKEESKNTSNPYIDSSLIQAQLDYNKSSNLQFEEQYSIGKKSNNDREQAQTPQSPQYKMHPFSQRIMDGEDPKLLTYIRRNKAPNPVVYRARFKNNNMFGDCTW